MKFERTALLLAAIVGAGLARADSGKLRIHVGYSTTGDFQLRDGSYAALRGPEVGVQFPIAQLSHLVSVDAYPSILLGGKFGSGNTTGEVYRFTLAIRQSLPGTGAFGFVGAGLAHTRSDNLNDTDGFETLFGGGVPVSLGPSPIQPNLEFIYHASTRAQIRGFTVGVSVGF